MKRLERTGCAIDIEQFFRNRVYRQQCEQGRYERAVHQHIKELVKYVPQTQAILGYEEQS